MDRDREQVVLAILALVECSTLDEGEVLETLVGAAGAVLQSQNLTGCTVEGKTGTVTLTVVNK